MDEGTIKSGKLAGRSMGAAIWILAAPVLLQQTMAACVGLVDKVVAGSLPDDVVVPALDGLGIGSYVGWFIGIAMAGLGIGGQALIARAIGAGNVDEGEQALGQAMTLCMLWGAAVGVVLWVAAPWLATVCGLTDAATTYLVQYVRVVSCGLPLMGVMMVGSMCLYGGGETTKPALIAIVVNLVNMVLSWALSGADLKVGGMVVENPFGFDLHVIGIALGTALAHAVGALLTIRVLARGVKDLRLRRHHLRLDRAMMKRIVHVGLPNFFEGISMWLANLVVLVIIGVIALRSDAGEGLLGANIIATQWESFSFLPGFAIGTAAGALAGQYLGAGNPRMARRAIIACSAIGVTVMGLIGLGFIFGGSFLTRIISDEPVHLDHVPTMLLYCGLCQVAFAVAMVVRQGLRGVGDTRWTFIITTVSSYGVRLPLAWWLGVELEMGIEGVWLGLCLELVVRAALFAARFLHGGWKRLVI